MEVLLLLQASQETGADVSFIDSGGFPPSWLARHSAALDLWALDEQQRLSLHAEAVKRQIDEAAYKALPKPDFSPSRLALLRLVADQPFSLEAQ